MLAKATADANDVMVMISATGFTPVITETAGISQAVRTSRSIALTPQDTPLAKIADILLPIKHGNRLFTNRRRLTAMLALRMCFHGIAAQP